MNWQKGQKKKSRLKYKEEKEWKYRKGSIKDRREGTGCTWLESPNEEAGGGGGSNVWRKTGQEFFKMDEKYQAANSRYFTNPKQDKQNENVTFNIFLNNNKAYSWPSNRNNRRNAKRKCTTNCQFFIRPGETQMFSNKNRAFIVSRCI